MKFIPVKSLPEPKPRHPKKDLEIELYTFLQMNTRIAKVEYHHSEYTSSLTCASSLRGAAEKYGYPIEVTIVNGDVYLIRKSVVPMRRVKCETSEG